MIEYLAPNGHSWNPTTGCLHGLDICATSPTCWARAMSRRFKAACGGAFKPRYHPDRLLEPFQWHKPRRVAVSFMGDLFGDWVSCEAPTRSGLTTMDTVQHLILSVVRANPQHQFLFLTKRPANLARWNPWPDNAEVGISITGAETPVRQIEMMETLADRVQCRVRWLSYEPALGPLVLDPFEDYCDLRWLVVGMQSGPHAKAPERAWVEAAEFCARKWGIPVWRKDSLTKALGLKPTTELL